MLILQSLLGVLCFIFIAWAMSEDLRNIPYKLIVSGLGLQIVLAILFLKIPFFKSIFISFNTLVVALETATQKGTGFVFGYLGGAALPFEEVSPNASFVLAFKALPLILVVSALSSLLFYWKILPVIVRLFSKLLEKTMNIGGATGLGAAANIFVGMIEAPLIVRPYIKEMSRSDLFVLMTCGMATIAGTVMALYASIIGKTMPDAMGHILIASIMSAPAAILISRLMIPGHDQQNNATLKIEHPSKSAMDAITYGSMEGVKLLVNVIAMLIVLIALVHMANQLLSLLPMIDGHSVTLQLLLGYIMSPIAWLMGIPWQEAQSAGSLLGTKIILNEFLAYIELSQLSVETLSERSKFIMIYALCGFANFGSLGIMIGGIGSMCPERRSEIINLGLKSIVSGTLATCMTGTIAGLMLFN